MTPLLKTESYVATDAAWHQELTFDESFSVKIKVDSPGPDPIYGFYIDETDFEEIRRNGETNDEMMSRIEEQTLFEDATGHIESKVQFPKGKWFLCIELDCLAAPGAKRAEFTISLYEN